MPPPDPGAGAGPAPDAGDDSGGDDVVVTISKAPDGTYMVYAGDEPDEGGGGGADMSEDDDDAMGGGGGGMGAGAAAGPPGGGSAGQPADSIGAALKLAMDIMQADKSSEGAPGSADDQFAAGFGASKSPTPVGMGGGA
jgi:hypothetical protein